MQFYARSTHTHPNNVYNAVQPFIDNTHSNMFRPEMIAVVPPPAVNANGSGPAVFLLPGHPLIQEFDTQITLAYSSDKINQPILLTFNKLCDKVADQ